MDQPVGSPTQIAREFNQNFSGTPVRAQTVKKWLLSEAMPTQPKLLALAAWLGVSAQWLRYGTGDKTESLPKQANVVVLGKEYASLVPLLDKLSKLSARDMRIVEGMVQLMHAKGGGQQLYWTTSPSLMIYAPEFLRNSTPSPYHRHNRITAPPTTRRAHRPRNIQAIAPASAWHHLRQGNLKGKYCDPCQIDGES